VVPPPRKCWKKTREMTAFRGSGFDCSHGKVAVPCLEIVENRNKNDGKECNLRVVRDDFFPGSLVIC